MEKSKQLQTLFRTRDINIAVADFYNAYFHEYSQEIDENVIKNQLKKYHSPEKALYYAILEVMGIQETEEDFQEAKNVCHIGDFQILKKETYEQNPYVKTIGILRGHYKDWKLEEHTYYPYEAFLWKDVTIDPNTFAEYSSLGFFLEPFSYLAITQKDIVWMSLTPHEIETMQPVIDQVKGDVLVLGLGLGYFPFMIARKKEVTSITIVEKDASAIELFSHLLLPHFPHPEKIHLVREDAFSYLQKKISFDDCFVDLWHQAEDGLPLYLKTLRLEHNHPKTRFFYWIEESMLCLVRRTFLNLLEDHLDGIPSSQEEPLSLYLEKLLQKCLGSSRKDVPSLLSSSSLKKYLKEGK